MIKKFIKSTLLVCILICLVGCASYTEKHPGFYDFTVYDGLGNKVITRTLGIGGYGAEAPWVNSLCMAFPKSKIVITEKEHGQVVGERRCR